MQILAKTQSPRDKISVSIQFCYHIQPLLMYIALRGKNTHEVCTYLLSLHLVRLGMLPQRAGICVPLCTSRVNTCVRFLETQRDTDKNRK